MGVLGILRFDVADEEVREELCMADGIDVLLLLAMAEMKKMGSSLE